MGVDLWTKSVAGLIGLVAPAAALRWASNRQKMLSYVGASRSGHNAAWLPRRRSADAELRKDNALLVARARDLVNNNVYVSGGLEKLTDNVVRTGIFPQLVHARTGEALNNLEEKWKKWAKKVAFVEKQKLVFRHWWVDGEILVHDWLDTSFLPLKLCPLRLTLHESDILDETVDGVLNKDEFAKRGVVFNLKGDPVRYECYSAHPGDYLPRSLSRVSYSAEHMLHFFVPQRASQTRGVSRLAQLIEEIYDLAEYKSSERIAARLAAAFGVFVKTSDYSVTAANVLGGLPSGEQSLELGDYIEPGRIQQLPVGTEIQVAKNDRPGTTYEPYLKSSLKGQSVGFGLRYGNFSHDYTDSSYSSERSASLDERRGWVVQQGILNEKFNQPVFEKWLTTAFAAGLLDGLHPEDVVVRWQNPGWSWIDPTRDAKAAQMELDMGVTTRRQICAAKGLDFDEILSELKKEEEQIKQLRGIND